MCRHSYRYLFTMCVCKNIDTYINTSMHTHTLIPPHTPEGCRKAYCIYISIIVFIIIKLNNLSFFVVDMWFYSIFFINILKYKPKQYSEFNIMPRKKYNKWNKAAVHLLYIPGTSSSVTINWTFPIFIKLFLADT